MRVTAASTLVIRRDPPNAALLAMRGYFMLKVRRSGGPDSLHLLELTDIRRHHLREGVEVGDDGLVHWTLLCIPLHSHRTRRAAVGLREAARDRTAR